MSWHLKSLATWLFVKQLVQPNNKESIKTLHYWPFVRGIECWLLDSLHTVPITLEMAWKVCMTDSMTTLQRLGYPTPIEHNGLTHWGRVTQICVSKKSIIGSDKGLSPGRRQAIIWTTAGILLIGSLWTNFSEILIRTWARRKSKWTTGGYGALRRCGCSLSGKGTQFHCLIFRLGSAGERTICSHCYDVLNEDVVCEMAAFVSRPQCVKRCQWGSIQWPVGLGINTPNASNATRVSIAWCHHDMEIPSYKLCVTSGFPSERASNSKTFACHDLIGASYI